MAKRTNATDNILGFDYQKLVALKYCLNAECNQVIYIECYGDIALGDESVEVKHKVNPTTMGDRSTDFWKTLRNLIDDKAEYTSFKHFKLHTTAKVTDKSIFDGWNKKSAAKRLNEIRGVTSNKSIDEYHKVVSNEPDLLLEELLGRITIESSQSDITKLIDELTSHASMKFIPVENRIHLLDKMHGYISRQAILNRHEWKVEVNEFNRDIQSFCSRYHGHSIPFPKVRSSEVSSGNNNFIFSNCMENIGYSDIEIIKANTDYLRMSITDEKLLKKVSPEDIEEFRDDALDDIVDIKFKFIGKRKEYSCSNKASRDMYDTCLSENFGTIPNVDGMKSYYQKGTVHYLVENSKFKIDLKVD